MKIDAYLELPYFEQNGHIITYLGQHPYANVEGLDLSSPAGDKFKTSEGLHVARIESFTADPNGEKILVIEPHPDDFALSASGLVLTRLAKGATCTILNVFSRTATDKFPWDGKVNLGEDDFEQLRLMESRLAVELYLGQTFHSLRLPLASLRGHHEVFGTDHNEPELVKTLGELIVEQVQNDEIDTVLFPLAIQGHKDHLLTHDAAIAARSVVGDACDFIMYEDYPYARNKLAYSSRLAKVQRLHAEELYIAVDAWVAIMANMAIIYRSQFDDINRDQMLAIMREDYRAVSAEAREACADVAGEHMQRYWRLHED